MLPGRQEGGAEGPVRPEEFQGLAVHGGRPAVGIVDFTEHGQAVRRGLVAVTEGVGRIGFHLDGVIRPFCRSEGGHRHILAHDGRRARVHQTQEADLIIRGKRRHRLVHEPRRTEGIGVVERRQLAIQHHVAGVQHIQHRSVLQGARQVFQGFHLAQFAVHGGDFLGKVLLDEVLVALVKTLTVRSRTR